MTKIAEILKTKRTLSLEVFPPKADQPLEPLLDTLESMYGLNPDFISCTCGAGGTNVGRSLEICGAIRKSDRTEALAHITCIGNTRGDILSRLDEYRAAGIENFLALRGDLPAGWEGTSGDFSHADALLRFIECERPGLCLAAACYPEKHLRAESFNEDIRHLKGKQDAGAQYLISQLCHDVPAFERFLGRIQKAGVTLPVLAGVMPVLNKDGIVRMTLFNGCSIPRELAEVIGRYGNDPDDFKRAGKEYTVRQLEQFSQLGIAGIHLYTLNKYPDVADIVEAVRLG